MPNANSTASDDDVLAPSPSSSSSFGGSKRLWALICLPLVVLATGGWFWFASVNELQSHLDDWKSKGWPTSADEVNDFYRVPAGVNDRTQEWVAAIEAVGAANSHSKEKYRLIFGSDKEEIPPPGQPWDNFEAGRVLALSLDNELQLVLHAASVPGQVRFPHNFSNGIDTLLPDTKFASESTRLLNFDARLCAHEGNYARTLQDTKAIFAFSDAISGEPSTLPEMLRIATYSVGVSSLEAHLPHSGWTDAELSSLQDAVSVAHFETEMQRAMACETAIALSEIDKLPIGPLRNTNKLSIIKVMDKAIGAFSQPWPMPTKILSESTAEINRLLSQWSANQFKDAGLRLFIPALDDLGQSTCRAVACQRYVNLGLAAYRHQLKHGQLPASLDELDKSLIADLPSSPDATIDPFSGRPLRFRKDATGLLIYSVSRNLIDDGGAVVSSKTNHPPGDFGFQILIPIPANK